MDKQLVALCLGVWVLAAALILFQWKGMWIDYHLGNIKEGFDDAQRLDQESFDALAKRAAHDPATVEHLRRELENPQRVDQRYRITVLMVLARTPSEAAFAVVEGAAEDYDPRMRANAYRALSERALAAAAGGGEGPASPLAERAFAALLRGLGDPEPNARGFAAASIGKLGDERALWPLLRVLRDGPGDDGRPARAAAAEALRAFAGVPADELPYDPDATLAERDAQVLAWERWYASAGHTIPAGESLAEVRAAAPPSLGGEEGDAAARPRGASAGSEGASAAPEGDAPGDPPPARAAVVEETPTGG